MSGTLFIGGGNMARAIIGGLLRTGSAAQSIAVLEPVAGARTKLETDFAIRTFAAPDAAFATYDTWVMAVKPQHMREAAQSVAGFAAHALVISVAAGTRTDDLSAWLGGTQKIVRVMPNTPALIGAGISALYAPKSLGGSASSEGARAQAIMAACGKTVWVEDENLMDPVTAVSGSGPAYAFYLMEAMIDAGIELGLEPATARELAVTTLEGAAKLAAASPLPLSTLRENVTSKGGTTAAALGVMDERAVKTALKDAVKAASARGAEMAKAAGRG